MAKKTTAAPEPQPQPYHVELTNRIEAARTALQHLASLSPPPGNTSTAELLSVRRALGLDQAAIDDDIDRAANNLTRGIITLADQAKRTITATLIGIERTLVERARSHKDPLLFAPSTEDFATFRADQGTAGVVVARLPSSHHLRHARYAGSLLQTMVGEVLPLGPSVNRRYHYPWYATDAITSLAERLKSEDRTIKEQIIREREIAEAKRKSELPSANQGSELETLKRKVATLEQKFAERNEKLEQLEEEA